KMMLVTGAAVAGAGSLLAASNRRNIKQVARRVLASNALGRSLISLANGTYDEWLNEVGATFTLGASTNMLLTGVRALPTSGARAEEIAATGWPAPMQAAFLEQQHRAQHAHYRSTWPEGEWLLIERAGEPIGRLYLARQDDMLLLVDISLLPGERGAGLGGAI